MKKQYVKPTMLVEDFVLNDYIAACNLRVNFNQGVCAPPSGMSFNEKNMWQHNTFLLEVNCEQSTNGPEFDGAYCYHTPTGTNVLATS